MTFYEHAIVDNELYIGWSDVSRYSAQTLEFELGLPVRATTCLPVALLQVVQALWVALLANVGLVDHKVLASSLLR